jgi:AcrR family transcriptional regulator
MSIIERTAIVCSGSEDIIRSAKSDRRVQRTVQLLRTAMLALIQEKGFEALTVQDIIDRANVGRATFYTHFDNKEDLLLSGFDALRASLKDQQRQARLHHTTSDERLFAFSHEIFEHVAAYRSVFRAMIGRPSGALVEQLLHKMMADLIRDDVQAMLAGNSAGRESPPASIEAIVQFLAGGLFGLLRLWAEGKLRLSVEDANDLFRKLALPAVKSASR